MNSRRYGIERKNKTRGLLTQAGLLGGNEKDPPEKTKFLERRWGLLRAQNSLKISSPSPQMKEKFAQGFGIELKRI